MIREGYPSRISDDPMVAKAAIFQMLGYKMYAEEVLRFHQSMERVRIIDAPARTSKSFSAANDGLALVFPTNPLSSTLTYLVGPDYGTLKEFEYYWHVLVENFGRLGIGGVLGKHINNPANGNMVIEVLWGRGKDGQVKKARIEGKSATNARALQGDQVDVAILSEACEQPAEIWDKYLSPRVKMGIFPSTPKPQAQWIKDLIDLSYSDPETGISHFHYPPDANPEYDWQIFEQEQRKALYRAREKFGPQAQASDDPFFAEQFLGDWVSYTGKVLPFNERTHVLDIEAEQLASYDCRFTVSTDYGFRDPAVALFWATLSGGINYLFDEVYQTGLTNQQYVDLILETLARHRIAYHQIIGDPQKPEVNEIIKRDCKIPLWEGNQKVLRDRAAGHRKLVDLMTPQPCYDGGVRPLVYVSRRCRKTIHEWNSLVWKEGIRDESSATAMRGRDDAYDAARYFGMSRVKSLKPQKKQDWLKLHQRRVRERRRMEASGKLALIA